MRVVVTGEPFSALPLTSARMMREIGILAAQRIYARTIKGLGSDGQTFAPLSARYAEQKQKALGHSRADLTVSGRMLNDMGPTAVTDDSVTIAFRSSGGGGGTGTFIQRSRALGAQDKAFYHQEGGRVLRPFFDLNDADEDALAEAIERYLARASGGSL